MQLHWHTEPLLLISILACLWLYTLLIGPYREIWDPGHHVPMKLHTLSFVSGISIVYLAVGSPLDQLSEDYLFFLHMIQHMLLVYVIPPLLFLGFPQQLAEYLLGSETIRKIIRALVHPVVAGFTFSIVYTLWHIPLLYEVALRNKPIHILEHATMFGTAVMMWWPFLSPTKRFLRRSSYGIRILYAFLLMVAQLPVFAFLSFANVAIYETYVWAPRLIPGLDPLNDQVLGGIIMKVTNMIVSLTLISVCFYKWSAKEHDAESLVPLD